MSRVSNLERTMTMKVTPEQMRAIKRAAKMKGMRTSQYMRTVLVRDANSVVTQNGTAQFDAPRLP
jgi:uncharacterized protein (DUF1778 family)